MEACYSFSCLDDAMECVVHGCDEKGQNNAIGAQGFMKKFWFGGGDDILTATLLLCVFLLNFLKLC